MLAALVALISDVPLKGEIFLHCQFLRVFVLHNKKYNKPVLSGFLAKFSRQMFGLSGKIVVL
jgi:hypothetical protein